MFQRKLLQDYRNILCLALQFGILSTEILGGVHMARQIVTKVSWYESHIDSVFAKCKSIWCSYKLLKGRNSINWCFCIPSVSEAVITPKSYCLGLEANQRYFIWSCIWRPLRHDWDVCQSPRDLDDKFVIFWIWQASWDTFDHISADPSLYRRDWFGGGT